MDCLALATTEWSRILLELIQKNPGKTGISFSKQEATTLSSIWDPRFCSIKIPIQVLRQLRLRWAQRGWIRRESQTLLTRQRSEDSTLAASAAGSSQSSQALIKPWTCKSNTQSAAGLLHWGLQTSFQCCFGLPQLLQLCDLRLGLLIFQGKVSPELVVLENTGFIQHLLWGPDENNEGQALFEHVNSLQAPAEIHILKCYFCNLSNKYPYSDHGHLQRVW